VNFLHDGIQRLGLVVYRAGIGIAGPPPSVSKESLVFNFRTASAAALLSLGVVASSLPAFAAEAMVGMKMDAPKARFSDAVSYVGKPNLPLTVSMVVAGGGPGKFETTTLVKSLAGDLTAAELKSLTDKYGAEKIGQFVKTFDFVVADTLKIVSAAKIELPAPQADAKDGKGLSAALYTVGVTKDGNFDVEFMLDNLVSHPIHTKIMDDIDAKYGRTADQDYHMILTQAMKDLKAAYKL